MLCFTPCSARLPPSQASQGPARRAKCRCHRTDKGAPDGYVARVAYCPLARLAQHGPNKGTQSNTAQGWAAGVALGVTGEATPGSKGDKGVMEADFPMGYLPSQDGTSNPTLQRLLQHWDKSTRTKGGPTEDIPDAGTALTSSGDITATEVTSLVPHPSLRIPRQPGFCANLSQEPGHYPVVSHNPVKKGKEAPGTALAGNGAARGRDIFSP